MAIIVTGGTGFIGAEVLRLLLEQGESDLVAFDINADTSRLDEIASDVELVRGDVGNFSQVLSLVQRVRPKAIYHLGGMLSAPSEIEPAASFQANAAGTFYVLEAARLFDVPKVIFSSTVGTYGDDIEGETIDDLTLQRPVLFYGATKLFGELMGRFHRRKHGLDFRGVRFPVVIGPGVRTPGVAQFASWAIENSALGKPFELWVEPRTRLPSIYYKDAARSVIDVAIPPMDEITTQVYALNGFSPAATAGELVAMIERKVQGAALTFAPDPDIQAMLDKALLAIDDRRAREEWGWSPRYDLEAMVDDFLSELDRHPQRYR